MTQGPGGIQVWSCSSYRSKIYGHNPHPKPGLLLQMFLVNKCSFSGFLSAPPTPCSIWRRVSKQLKISVRPSTSSVRLSTSSGYDVQILKIFCSDMGWYSGTTPATLLDISSINCLKHNPEKQQSGQKYASVATRCSSEIEVLSGGVLWNKTPYSKRLY